MCHVLESLVQGVLADVSIFTGYATIVLMLTGRFVFQYLGWRVAAMATPVIMLLTGGAFFGLSLAATAGGSSLAVGHFNMASAGALAGAVTQVCTPAPPDLSKKIILGSSHSELFWPERMG